MPWAPTLVPPRTPAPAVWPRGRRVLCSGLHPRTSQQLVWGRLLRPLKLVPLSRGHRLLLIRRLLRQELVQPREILSLISLRDEGLGGLRLGKPPFPLGIAELLQLFPLPSLLHLLCLDRIGQTFLLLVSLLVLSLDLSVL